MRFKAGHFQKLKVPGIGEFMHLERAIYQNEAMPILAKLCMTNNRMVKIIPAGIESISKPIELNFVDMATELGTKIRGSGGQGGTEYEQIKHVREVNWVYEVANAWMSESLLVTDTNEESENPGYCAVKAIFVSLTYGTCMQSR